MIVLVVLVPIAVVALFVARSQSRSNVADAGWSSPDDVGPTSATSADCRQATSAETVRAIGRVEGRLLFWSPWFSIGLGFLALIVLMYAILYPDDSVQTWAEYAELSPWFLHPLVGMVILASHRAATRSTRDGAEEVFGVCPTRPEIRTVGHLAASWLPVVVSVVFLIGFALLLVIRSPDVHGSFFADSAADFIGALLLCVGGVALGVALGRWIQFALAPVLVIVAILFLSSGLSSIGGSGWNPYVQFSTAPTIEASSEFADRPAWSHALWILALVMLVAVVAMLRHRRDKPIFLVGAAAVALAMIAAFGVTREMPSASAAAIADRVARPEVSQDCVDIDDRVDVCVFSVHPAVADRIAAAVAPVVLALPDEVGPMTIRQVYDGRIEKLPPEVRRLLPRPFPSRPANEIPFSGFSTAYGLAGQGADLAFTAVGLPTRPDDAFMPLVVAGEARGVVALWLSVRGLDLDDQLQEATSGESDPYLDGSGDDVELCEVPSVVWSRQDLEAARAVIQLPEATVVRALGTDWSRWIDPATGTDELLAHLELPSVGPFDQLTPRPGRPC